MAFNRNNDKYREAFGNFQHSSGKTIRLFPFTSTVELLPKSFPDLKNFRGIAGGLCRNSLSITQLKAVSREELITSVVAGVKTDQTTKLGEIIAKVLFDDKGSILLFSHQVLPYLTSNNSNKQMKTIEAFIAHLLLDADIKKLLSEKIKEEDKTNILHKIVLEELSKLTAPEASDHKGENYYAGKILLEVRSLFANDVRALMGNPKLFSTGLAELIKFYYFIYIIRLASSLNNFFNLEAKPQRLYFSLEWERLSKSRPAVDNGWHVLKNMISPFFAHSNCIEMLNTININPRFGMHSCFIYSDLVAVAEHISLEEENELIRTLTHFVTDYRGKFCQLDWEKFKKEYVQLEWHVGGNHAIYDLVHQLFSSMRYQFENTPSTRTAYNSYSSWFNEFAQKNYHKSRGPLGSTLKIDKETLLLFTEISIMATGKEKILISQLWIALEKRDILLDPISKKEVIHFFDKINILEKKSDSDDAQFVKRLYKQGL